MLETQLAALAVQRTVLILRLDDMEGIENWIEATRGGLRLSGSIQIGQGHADFLMMLAHRQGLVKVLETLMGHCFPSRMDFFPRP